MIDPKMLEAWHRMMAEAMRAASDAGDAMRAFAPGPDAVRRMMEAFAASAATPDDAPQPPAPREEQASPEAWMTQWYRTMDVVPGARHRALLGRYRALLQAADAGDDDALRAAVREHAAWLRTFDEATAGGDASGAS